MFNSKINSARKYNKERKKLFLGKDDFDQKLYPGDFVELSINIEMRTPWVSRIWWDALHGAYVDAHPGHIAMKLSTTRELSYFFRKKYDIPFFGGNGGEEIVETKMSHSIRKVTYSDYLEWQKKQKEKQCEKKKGIKPVFVFNIHSVIDIITNSSSELFVLEGETKRIVSNLITSIYPQFRKEYEEPKLLSFLNDEELDSYVGWIYNTYGTNLPGDYGGKLYVFPGFTFEEMYKEEDRRWGDRTYFSLKDDFITKNRDKIIEIMDPENKTWLLYSIDDNPNHEYQEKLSEIGTRYHLG